MKKSIISLAAIALAGSMLVACNDEEELVPQMQPAKPAAQASAPKAEEQPKAEEPELVPLQSLSANTKADEAAEDAQKKAPAPTGSVQRR